MCGPWGCVGFFADSTKAKYVWTYGTKYHGANPHCIHNEREKKDMIWEAEYFGGLRFCAKPPLTSFCANPYPSQTTSVWGDLVASTASLRVIAFEIEWSDWLDAAPLGELPMVLIFGIHPDWKIENIFGYLFRCCLYRCSCSQLLFWRMLLWLKDGCCEVMAIRRICLTMILVWWAWKRSVNDEGVKIDLSNSVLMRWQEIFE